MSVEPRHDETLTPDDLNRPEWNSLLDNYDKHDIGEVYFKGRVEQIGLTVEHWGIDKRHEDDHLIFDNKMDLRLWEPLDGQERPPKHVDHFDAIHTGLVENESGSVAPEPNQNVDNLIEHNGYDEVQWRLRGVVDIKTKASKSWLGKFNLRHLAHYSEWADRYSVPVFIYMTMVDPSAQEVGQEAYLMPIPSDWPYERLVAHYDTEDPTELSYGELKDTARESPLVHNAFRAPDGNLVVETNVTHQHDFDWLVQEVL